MAAQNFKTTKAAQPAPFYAAAGVLMSQYFTYTLPEVPEVGDTYDFFKLPRGAQPVGGEVVFTDIDTGTETFELDIGIANAETDATIDADYFLNSGVITGDAVTPALTNGAERRVFNGPFPGEPLLLQDTYVRGTVIAVAAAGGTGTVTVRVDYLCPQFPTS